MILDCLRRSSAPLRAVDVVADVSDGLEGNAKDRTGFGIHGTKDPDQIGKADSRGCIRMYNGEVKLVYDLLVEGISTVRVVE